jgi:hypothetical protein
LKSLCSRSASAFFGGCLAAPVFLLPPSAPAQEALRNSLAGEAAAESRHIHPESLPYTFKTGELRVLVSPSLGCDWNDNINIAHTNALQDFILTPAVQVIASYPVSKLNLLSLNVGIGYDQYIEHSQYSTWSLQSGSALSFDMYIKDFWINFHDNASYVQDPSQQAAVANTANYATVVNTVGLLTTWDLEDVTLSLGYDHRNTFSGSSQFQSQNNASELLVGRAGLVVHPKLTVGVEATGSFTTYEQTVLNNNSGFSTGVYADFHPGQYFQVKPRFGYTKYFFQHTSQSIQTADVNGWYADLLITHQMNDVVSYSLDAGHELNLGIQSDVTEDWYVRPGINWNIIKDLSLGTSFSYQHGTQGQGNVAGNLTENYDWFTGGLNLSYPIMKKLTASLNYRLTVRSSNQTSREYTQNLVGLLLTYQAR